MSIERPPILRGSAERQLAALRDYLFRLAGSLDTAAAAPAAGYVLRKSADGKSVYAPGGGGTDDGTEKAAIERMRKNARELKALILKTADEIEQEMDRKEEEYHGTFIARSEFGEFEERTSLLVETTAKDIVETYRSISAVRSDQADIELLQDYMTQLNGEIRRGFLEDPDNPGETVFGIAVSAQLRFTGAVRSKDGYEYHELEGNQTLGLYTASGWQFWIDGHRAGWFDSMDGMLHVANVYVEDALTFGGSWRARRSGTELEILYVGGS